VKGCTRVYLEAYTSILMVDKTKLVSAGLEAGGCISAGSGVCASFRPARSARGSWQPQRAQRAAQGCCAELVQLPLCRAPSREAGHTRRAQLLALRRSLAMPGRPVSPGAALLAARRPYGVLLRTCAPAGLHRALAGGVLWQGGHRGGQGDGGEREQLHALTRPCVMPVEAVWPRVWRSCPGHWPPQSGR
jgi:hypothetical protein